MRYRVHNEKGEPIAQYQNESEVRSFLKASIPNFNDDEWELDSGTVTVVADEDGQERFTITDTQADRRPADRPTQPDSGNGSNPVTPQG